MSHERTPRRAVAGTPTRSGPPGGTLDLSPVHLALAQAILHEHLPGVEVRAFGSRVNGSAKRFSDLDLIVMAAPVLPTAVWARLADAFSESDLPFRVDVLDGSATDAAFREQILARSVLVQAANEPTDGQPNGDSG